LNYLEKLVEQHFSRTLFDASESAKNTFFCDVTKVENFDKKNVLLYQKRTKKVHLNIFDSVDQNPQ
jgi:hypothetical protein